MAKGLDPRRGVYNAVLPLDVLILKELPNEGATFMGVYPEGASVTDLNKRIAGGEIGTTIISTRLRVLHLHDMAISVKVPRSPTAGWQITKAGKKFLADQEPGDGSQS